MKRHLSFLMNLGAAAFFGIVLQNNVVAQCDTWEKYPSGKEEATKQHVIYRDFFKQKKYDEAYPIWEELFKYVQIPAPNKKTHFDDGIEMSVFFAKKETDPAKKSTWLDKMMALYENSAKCNGEDASNRAYQAYYMYANNYKMPEAYKIMEKALELGKDAPPAMTISHIARVAVSFYTNKQEGFDKDKMVALYDKLKKYHDANVNGKEGASYKKYWTDAEAMFNTIPEIFGCEYWTSKYGAIYKSVFENADTLKVMAVKLAEKCGKDADLYKEIWAQYKNLNYAKEIVRQKEITAADSSTIFSKMQAYRALAELDSVNEKSYKDKVNELIPELANSKKEWLDDKTKGTEIYRYAFSLYRDGNFSNARTYCRLASKLRPDWGDPYILVGTMYASSGGRCSPATNGTGFDAQVCVWPAIDEWIKAKSVDPSAAEEANRLIGKYSAFMPSKSELAQRGIAVGSSFTVGCWIGQATSVRGI
jgi:hypothetical protein